MKKYTEGTRVINNSLHRNCQFTNSTAWFLNRKHKTSHRSLHRYKRVHDIQSTTRNRPFSQPLHFSKSSQH